MNESISYQQFLYVSSLASSIDDKLRIAQNILIGAATSVPRDALTNADAAQRFLDDKAHLLSIFDNGIFLISNKGRLIAENPYLSGRRGKDLSFREFVQQTIVTKKAYIFQLHISTHHLGQPALVMCVPIFASSRFHRPERHEKDPGLQHYRRENVRLAREGVCFHQ